MTFDSEEGKKTFWHTASHVLAQAVKHLYPEAKLAIGPAIDTGFYYDFDVEHPFSQEELTKIEAEMKKIVKANEKLEQFYLSPEEAVAKLKGMDEPYKVELCEEHAGNGEPISFYQQGDFTDLCAGPHLMSTGTIKAFKLLSCTGAYWRGSEKNKMLSRVYAVAFPKHRCWKNIWQSWKKPRSVTTISWDGNWNISPLLTLSVRACRCCCPRVPEWYSCYSVG